MILIFKINNNPIIFENYYYNLKLPFKDIAHLQSGVNVRPESTGNVRFLQISHFSNGSLIGDQFNVFVNSDEISPRHLLMPGDILFAAKGTNNFAVMAPVAEVNAAASPSFIVIRLKNPKEILPEFLVMFLNLPGTQAQIKTEAKGTAIPAISLQALANLNVHIPPLEKQQMLVAFAQLITLENNMLRQLAELLLKRNHLIIEKAISA